jgi:hypothetical protein
LQEWLGLREQGEVASHVFRLAGIYGPGRSALDTVRKARAAPSAEGREAAAPAPTPAPAPPSTGPATLATRSTWPMWSATLAGGVGGVGAGGAADAAAAAAAGDADVAVVAADERPRYVSRIHVADIAAALLASTEAPAASAADATYNLADDQPAPRTEVSKLVRSQAVTESISQPVSQSASQAGPASLSASQCQS